MKHINRGAFAVLAALAFALGGAPAFAATTISTDIVTGGALTVSGASSLVGIITAGANITIPAAYSFDVASAGQLNIGTSTATSIRIGKSGTPTTFPGQVTISGPLLISSTASTTGDFSVNGNATTSASTGNIATQGTLTVTGATTHTGATTFGGGTAVNNMVFGFCTISNSSTITASSSAYFNCTGATGVTSSHRVFVQATSSLSSQLIVQAASSTPTAGTINLQIFNTGGTAGTNVAPGSISLNFFGIR